MSTLGEMKATIAAEIMRDDLADAIAKEIDKAIKFYRSKRFWFNEKRSRVLFDTVAGQDSYTATDAADIPNLIRIDSVTSQENGRSIVVTYVDQARMELALNSSTVESGPPVRYSYYEQVLRLYPLPDAAYPIRIACVVRIAAPLTDDEPDNPWMTDAEELIRARAKRNIFANWMEDDPGAQRMAALENEALNGLIVETSSRTQVSRIIPDCI